MSKNTRAFLDMCSSTCLCVHVCVSLCACTYLCVYTPVPSTELTLCRFVATLAKDNIAYNSIKVYLAAIRQLHLREGQVAPDTGAMARLQQVLRGIKIAQSITRQPFQRKPISPDLLRDIKRAWEQTGLSQDRTMLWAAFLLCFFGFMRSGELCTQEENMQQRRSGGTGISRRSSGQSCQPNRNPGSPEKV